jgi:tetratricopeptide (TPR) repeat protein
MKRNQLFLILGALCIGVVLFTLPKALVNSKMREVATNEASKKEKADTASLSDQMKQAHAHEHSAEEKAKLSKWLALFASNNPSDKKASLADSIAGFYMHAHQYDSVAYFKEQVALLSPSSKNNVAAADAYMRAVDFADEKGKVTYSNQARAYYKKALGADTKNTEVKAKMAMTYVASENPMQGIKMLREVIEEDPKNETALYNLGYLSVQSGQYQKAIDRFDALLKVNPVHSSATFYLGYSFMQLGNKEKARMYFNKAKELEQDPEFQSILESYLKELNEL